MSENKKMIQINLEVEPEVESMDPYESATISAQSILKERENQSKVIFELIYHTGIDSIRNK